MDTMTAKERFDKFGGSEEPNPLERLRFFLSLALNKQDWFDVEQFLDDLEIKECPTTILTYILNH